MPSTAMVTVTWNKLELYQKQLVVAMFNNLHGVSDPGKYEEGEFTPMCNVLHAVCGYCPTTGPDSDVEHPLATWDAEATISDKGVLVISGAQGPSGQGLWHSVYMPMDVKIELGAST